MIRKKNGETVTVENNGNGNGNKDNVPTAGLLSLIKKSERGTTEKIVLYAPEGWGKTTWASKAPDPIFISAEDGLKGISVDVFPEAKTWDDVKKYVESLRLEKHNYRTLVLDTVDWTEHLCHKFLLERDKKTSIEDYGYGRGYVLSFEEWKTLLSPLDSLRKEKNMHIVFLAHSAIKVFNNPSGENFDRWELKTDRRVSSLIKEWSDCLLFGTYDISVDVKTGASKGKAYDGEKRIINCNHSAAWDAKNRYGIDKPLTNEDLAAQFWTIIGGTK